MKLACKQRTSGSLRPIWRPIYSNSNSNSQNEPNAKRSLPLLQDDNRPGILDDRCYRRILMGDFHNQVSTGRRLR